MQTQDVTQDYQQLQNLFFTLSPYASYLAWHDSSLLEWEIKYCQLINIVFVCVCVCVCVHVCVCVCMCVCVCVCVVCAHVCARACTYTCVTNVMLSYVIMQDVLLYRML